MLEQAACDEILGRLHHVPPHLEGAPLLIEKCEGLFSAHRAALFDPQTHEMCKRDFSDHAFSVFFLCHCLDPHWFIALQGIVKPKHAT